MSVHITGHLAGVKHIISTSRKAPGPTGQYPQLPESLSRPQATGQGIIVATTQTEAPPDECPQLSNLCPDLVAAL